MKESRESDAGALPLRIMLIDDDPNDRALVIRALKKDFPGVRVEEIIDAAGLEKALDEHNFDLVITDYHLYWTDGLSNLRAVRERYPDCPVIMFTGTGTEEVAVEAMKAGLDDYVLKSPKHYGRLSGSVHIALKNAARHREMKEIGNELRESEERYRSLFEIAPVGIFMLDPKGNIHEVNNWGCEIYGYSREEFLKLNVRDIIPKKIAGNFPRLVRNVRNKKRLFFESEGKKKDRKIFPLALSVSLFQWRGQEFVQVLVQDISDRKAAKSTAQLRRLSEKLFKYQEEERKHIARELHDHIGQDLAAIKISLQMLDKEYRLEKGLREELAETVKIAEKTIADVRRISSTLRPEALDRMGLLPSLKHEIEYMGSRGNIELSLTCRGLKDRLEPEVEIAVYRIVQEAVTNIMKHARAKTASVSLNQKGRALHLSIRDDGAGFPTGWEKATRGLGLVGIQERVQGVKGKFTIRSRPGKGSCLTATIPV